MAEPMDDTKLARMARAAAQRMRGADTAQDCAALTGLELKRYAKLFDKLADRIEEVIRWESRR